MTLVGWWKLKDGSGTVATDSSGNGNNGNFLDHPTWITTGPNGGGLSFRGFPISDDSVRIPRAVVLEPAAITISAWFRGAQAQNFRQSVFCKAFAEDVAPTFQSYQIGVQGVSDPTVAIFTIGITGGFVEVFVPGIILDNTAWQNLVGTYDPAASAPQQLLYSNGVLVGSATNTGPIAYDLTSTGDLYIASNSDPTGVNKVYFGSVDDCRIYNQALTAREIRALYGNNISTLRGHHGGSRMTPPYNP
jgi:hypothetical protein